MILEHAGNQLFTVYVDHYDLNRLAKLWKLVDRIEELHYSTRLDQLALFLSCLGPAPNLKVLDLRPELREGMEELTTLINLPTIFLGCLPSLRDLTLTNTVTWPVGLFRGLVSFDCGGFDHYPISAGHVFHVLRESPSIEFLRLVGYWTVSKVFGSPTANLPFLKECTLIGQGTTSLLRFLTIPASTYVFLSKPYVDEGAAFPKFDHVFAAQKLRVLDEISTVSFSISDCAVRLQAKNIHGGVLDAEVDELHDLTQDPYIFGHFLRSFFECGGTYPGFKTTQAFTLDVDRGWMWEHDEATCFTLDIMGFMFNLSGLEEVKLRGVPALELFSILEFLRTGTQSELPCPNLRRLDIESTPFRFPRPFLLALGTLLAERVEAGVPLQSVRVKVKCEMLIPAPEHHALLTSWRRLVEEGVKLEYKETVFRELPRRRRHDHEDEDEEDYEDEEDDEGEDEEDDEGEDEEEDEGEDEEGEDEEDEDEDEEDWIRDPDNSCAGWDGRPESWPATMGEIGEH